MTKVKHAKGGFSLRVERDEPKPAQQLERPITPQPIAPQPVADTPALIVITPVTARLCASFMAAIEAIHEAQAFADRRGLKVTFTSEDVRACAITAFIQAGR